jgi:hypothetical protein
MAAIYFTINVSDVKHACISDDGQFVVVYKQNLVFEFYNQDGQLTKTLDVL